MQQPQYRTGVIKPVECVKEGFELIKSDYWLLFAIWLVGGLIDGNPVKFDDLWKGMQWFLPGLVVMIFIVAPMIVLYAGLYVPLVLAAVMGTKLSQDEMMGMLVGAFIVDFILLIGMVCLHTLLIFSFPLIVDRNLGAVK